MRRRRQDRGIRAGASRVEDDQRALGRELGHPPPKYSDEEPGPPRWQTSFADAIAALEAQQAGRYVPFAAPSARARVGVRWRAR